MLARALSRARIVTRFDAVSIDKLSEPSSFQALSQLRMRSRSRTLRARAGTHKHVHARTKASNRERMQRPENLKKQLGEMYEQIFAKMRPVRATSLRS